MIILTKQNWPLQKDALAFYGNPRNPGWLHSHTVDVEVPWQMKAENIIVNHILINIKCADSLKRVLEYVWEESNKDQSKIEAQHFNLFSGSYNYRPMRGGSALSMHSYAAAIDWDDAENQQHSVHHLFNHNTLLIKAFLAEGWIWGGDWSVNSIDAMHVQAGRLH